MTITAARWTRRTLVAVAVTFYALHFLHLNADFPNGSPWVDWSKYTDEGWYGDGAIRQVLFGHWYWKGDFNPAVALPVWPFLEFVAFKLVGVSAAAGRALTLVVFLVTLLAAWVLLERHTRRRTAKSGRPLAAPIAVLLLCTSPFFYVFERMAILEPLLVCLTLLALIAADFLRPLHLPKRDAGAGQASYDTAYGWRSALRDALPALALGLLLPAMVLTKTTAVFLAPSIGWMVWARAGYRLRPALRLGWLPAAMAVVIWGAYYALLVHPHYLEDYRYLFSANAYTGIELEPFATVILNTIADGVFMGKVVYPLFFVVLGMGLFWRPRFFLNRLTPALLLWAGGYFVFLAYHNNLQPRYYLVVAMPITLLVAMGIDCFREARGPRATWIASSLAAVAVLGIVIPDARLMLDFVLHPEYTFRGAAEGIAKIVRADKSHSNLVLSISGSDLTLMTGVPSIDDDFGTMELADRVKAYKPGWYAAWNELDDDKMDALASSQYRIERVAAFPAMDDPDRNLLILYRLDPAEEAKPRRGRRQKTPKPLQTKIGQQPTTQQLEH